MRRFLINTLAAIGGLVVLGSVTDFLIREFASRRTGVVLGRDRKPLVNVPVFLDRGSSAIERYTTDSAGAFTLPLAAREIRHAVWLICEPGGVPMVDSRDENQVGPTTYEYAALSDSTYGSYRAFGWRGPIPRECPRATDTMGWRYPASAGRPKYAFTTTEPEWPR